MTDNGKRNSGKGMTPSFCGGRTGLHDDEDLFPESIFAHLGPDLRATLKNFLFAEDFEELVVDLADSSTHHTES